MQVAISASVDRDWGCFLALLAAGSAMLVLAMLAVLALLLPKARQGQRQDKGLHTFVLLLFHRQRQRRPFCRKTHPRMDGEHDAL